MKGGITNDKRTEILLQSRTSSMQRNSINIILRLLDRHRNWIFNEIERKRMKEKQSFKEKIEDKIDDFIEYDNKHHCFRPFVIGFCTATIIAQIIILIALIIKF